jgi:hypothetical protein
VNAYCLYFFFFPDDAPPPASSSSSPASRTASLLRCAPLRPVATEVTTPVSPLLWTPRPSSRGRTPDAPRRRAAAGDAGQGARLGRVFLQVPPPSPTRTRRLPSLAPLDVGSRPVLVVVAPCRCVRVALRSRSRAPVRAATPSRRRAPQHARSVTLEARPGLWTLPLRRTSSSHSPSPAPPWPRRGGLPRARGRRGASATLLTGECAFRHRSPFPRAFEPSCGHRVHRHPWRRPKRRRAVCDHSVQGQARVDHLSAHAHPSARLRAHVGRPPDQKGVPAPTPPPRRRRRARAGADHGATAVTPGA